ncbi:hypothetical protein ABLN87_21190 [Ruegeria sp. SCPT10]|uniref:hypothetical protein n=1 Tax=Ruegeria sp. SCP10 TaxID=3141377 RepID=UPI0033382D38
MKVFSLILFSCIIITIFVQTGSAQVQTSETEYKLLPNGDQPYPLLSVSQDVKQALRVFARNLNVTLKMEGEITGTIQSKGKMTLSKREYIDRIASELDLVWYFDGLILHVASRDSLRTRIFPLSINNGNHIIEVLVTLGVFQREFIHNVDEKNRILLVTGPDSYIQIVDEALKSLSESELKTVAMIRGRSEVGISSIINAPDSDLSEVLPNLLNK